MMFHSIAFILGFMPVCIGGFFAAGRLAGGAWPLRWLIAANLVFYAWWDPAQTPILIASVAGNYAIGCKLGRGGATRPWLTAGVLANLLLLGWFKYANFFLHIVLPDAGAVTVALPLGISFFTFQQIMFLVDSARAGTPPPAFGHYAAFVTFFPHLIAGPIVRPGEIIPQLSVPVIARPNSANLTEGLHIFLLGLAKKLVLADMFAGFADVGFNAASHGAALSFFEAWYATLSFGLQIYFDFSGYSDMATGLARMLNVRFPLNFDSPYRARDIADFWRRWHITLGAFLRDYLYIPLGGNRKGTMRRYINLMITMLLGGLWHGAGWTFVAWGALHGIYLTINNIWRDATAGTLPGRIVKPAGGAITFIAVVTAWVVFRSTDIVHAKTMLEAMFGIHARPISFDAVLHGQLLLATDLSGRDLIKILFLSLAWVWLLPNSSRLRFIKGSFMLALLQAAVVVCFLALAIDQFGSYSPFLYFRF